MCDALRHQVHVGELHPGIAAKVMEEIVMTAKVFGQNTSEIEKEMADAEARAEVASGSNGKVTLARDP